MKKLAIALTALFALTACGGTGPDVSIKGSNSSEAPQSCLAALDMADEAMGIAADGFSTSTDMMGAIFDSDYMELESLTRDLDGLTDRMNEISPKYNKAKSDCRAGK